MALIESPGDHGITYPSQHWPFLGSQKVTPVSPLHGFFHTSVPLLMKLPASWHSSFHSGYQDSVEKYIPQLWLKQGKNTLIPSAVHSSGDPDPLGGFVYLQNTVNLKAPSNPTLWWSLTFRSVRRAGDRTSGRFRHGCRVMERGTPRGKDRQGPRGAHRGSGSGGSAGGRGGSAGGRRDQLVGCYVGTLGHSHRWQRERRKRRAWERRARRCREARVAGTASSDVSDCHRHTAGLWTQSVVIHDVIWKMDLCWLITTI